MSNSDMIALQPADGYFERREHLICLLQGYTPNPKEQVLVRYWVNCMEEEKEEQTTIIRSLVTALADGLLYGNWPWVTRPSLLEEF